MQQLQQLKTDLHRLNFLRIYISYIYYNFTTKWKQSDRIVEGFDEIFNYKKYNSVGGLCRIVYKRIKFEICKKLVKEDAGLITYINIKYAI